MTSFYERVCRVVSRISEGEVKTYKEVARLAGNARAARAVGTILRTYDARMLCIPCHRVIKTDGTLGGYRWGIEKKRTRLIREGMVVKGMKVLTSQAGRSS